MTALGRMEQRQFLRGACPESYRARYARELQQTLDSPGGRLFRQTNTTYLEIYAYVDRMPANTEPAFDLALRGSGGGGDQL